MNLIRCSNDCVYQKDGCCTLDKPQSPTASTGGCCYFQPRAKASPPAQKKKT